MSFWWKYGHFKYPKKLILGWSFYIENKSFKILQQNKNSQLCHRYSVILAMHVIIGTLAYVEIWKIDDRLPKIKLFVLFSKWFQGYT